MLFVGEEVLRADVGDAQRDCGLDPAGSRSETAEGCHRQRSRVADREGGEHRDEGAQATRSVLGKCSPQNEREEEGEMVRTGEDVLHAGAKERSEAARGCSANVDVHVGSRPDDEPIDVPARQVQRRQVPVIGRHSLEEAKAKVEFRGDVGTSVRRAHAPRQIRRIERLCHFEVRRAASSVGVDREGVEDHTPREGSGSIDFLWRELSVAIRVQSRPRGPFIGAEDDIGTYACAVRRVMRRRKPHDGWAPALRSTKRDAAKNSRAAKANRPRLPRGADDG